MDYKQQMTEEELLTFLDTSIEHWREVKAAGTAAKDKDREKWAYAYEDAFQTTRQAVFGHRKK